MRHTSMPQRARNWAPITRHECPVKKHTPVGPTVGKPRCAAAALMAPTIAPLVGALPVLVGKSGASPPRWGKVALTHSTCCSSMWNRHIPAAAVQQQARARSVVNPFCAVSVGGRSRVTSPFANRTQRNVTLAASISRNNHHAAMIFTRFAKHGPPSFHGSGVAGSSLKRSRPLRRPQPSGSCAQSLLHLNG